MTDEEIKKCVTDVIDYRFFEAPTWEMDPKARRKFRQLLVDLGLFDPMEIEVTDLGIECDVDLLHCFAGSMHAADVPMTLYQNDLITMKEMGAAYTALAKADGMKKLEQTALTAYRAYRQAEAKKYKTQQNADSIFRAQYGTFLPHRVTQ